jgi:hypothetical protein
MTIFGKLSHARYMGRQIFFLLSILVGCLYATEERRMNTFPDTDKNVILGDTAIKGDVDSTEKYNYLIANENADSRYAQNVVGGTLNSVLFGRHPRSNSQHLLLHRSQESRRQMR